MPNEEDALIASEYDEPMFEVDPEAEQTEPESLLVEPETTTEYATVENYRPFDPTTQITGSTNGDSERLKNDKGEPLPEFDHRYRDDFEGLMFFGSLATTFTWMGHEFHIRTLLTDELLAVTIVTQKYRDTLGNGLAYRIAMAALCLVSVDGQNLPEPIGRKSDDYEWAFNRFNYVKARWFQFTIDAIYNEYLLLEAKVIEVVEAMGKASRSTASVPG
jgi:hypothetical protein